MIDFDRIAIDADRAANFRKVYGDVKKLRYFIRKHRETGDTVWQNKCRRYYRRMHEEYEPYTYPTGVVSRDHYTFPILMLACDLEKVQWVGYS